MKGDNCLMAARKQENHVGDEFGDENPSATTTTSLSMEGNGSVDITESRQSSGKQFKVSHSGP